MFLVARSPKPAPGMELLALFARPPSLAWVNLTAAHTSALALTGAAAAAVAAGGAPPPTTCASLPTASRSARDVSDALSAAFG